jgi:tetratricopeptide (TPR) repeat protein/DNA-binding SARP family transcriptional activator
MGGTERVFNIGCLGPFTATYAGSPLPRMRGRVGKLLALLAVSANTNVTLERITETLWEEPPPTYKQQIYNSVAYLRDTLESSGGHSRIHGDLAGYRLEIAREAVDVLRFQDLVIRANSHEQSGDLVTAARLLDDALREWRGSAFTGLSSMALTNIAVELDEQHLAVAERTGGLHFQLGSDTAPVAELMGLVRDFPFREPLRAIVMRLLHLRGRSAEAMLLFEEGRRLLLEELGMRAGSALMSAHEYVLTQNTRVPSTSEASALNTDQPEFGPVRSEVRAADSPVRLNAIPRDIPEFTGRQDELAQLLSQADSDTNTVVISAVDGMGGVGKTALAVHLAHRLSARYPDGQYFIDLQGFSGTVEPLSSEQALYMLLRDGGVQPELIPSDLPGRVVMWRSRLAESGRVIVLLDNAAGSAQVRPLLPGSPGPLVIIASRRRLSALEGASPVSLDAMPEADALELFSRIAGQSRTATEPDATREIVRLCGGLPLALQIAAARLRDRPAWSVAYLAEQLGDYRGRLRILRTEDREVMSIVLWSYRHLTPRQQTVFRLLALYPASHFHDDSVASLTGLDPAEAAECLDELFEMNLLHQSAGGFYLHDLVRDGAQLLLDEAGDESARVQATLGLADYFLSLSTAVYGALSAHPLSFEPTCAEPGPRPEAALSTDEAMDLLRGRHRTLTGLIRQCGSVGLNRHAWQLAGVLLPYFMRVNFGDDVDAALDVGLNAAREEASALGQSICLMGLSYSRRVHGNPSAACELMAEAIDLSREAEVAGLELRQRIGLGVMYMDCNEFETAKECFEEALSLARRLDSLVDEATLINNLGVVARELGCFDEALDHFQRTLALNESLKRPRLQSLAKSNIGQILYLRHRYSEAEHYFVQALELGRITESKEAEIVALIGLCTTGRLLGDIPASIAAGRQALELSRETGLRDFEGDALNALGDVYLGIGDIGAARSVFQNASSLAAGHDSHRYESRAEEGLAHVALAYGDVRAAEAHWIKALTTCPGGVVDALDSRQHLAAIEDGRRHNCWRCLSPSPY